MFQTVNETTVSSEQVPISDAITAEIALTGGHPMTENVTKIYKIFHAALRQQEGTIKPTNASF